jgi:hypothetical protein
MNMIKHDSMAGRIVCFVLACTAVDVYTIPPVDKITITEVFWDVCAGLYNVIKCVQHACLSGYTLLMCVHNATPFDIV